MNKGEDMGDMADDYSPGGANAFEESIKDKVSYHTKLAGVTFDGRQDIIKMLKGDEPLRTRREPENKYDPNAVAVDVQVAETWQPIGYIAKDKNKDICAAMDASNEVEISLASITGGGEKSFGVNVSLLYVKVSGEQNTEAKAKVDVTPNSETGTQESAKLSLGKTEDGGISNEAVVLESIKELLGVKSNRQTYKSRLIGKSVEVTVNDGHMSIPGYMGGSSFPEQFYPEFDKDGTIQSILDKFFKPEEHERAKASIIEMWGRSGEASTSYGTAVHAAMENYDKFRMLGDKTKKVEEFKTKPPRIGPNKALSSNPFLAKIVQDFHDKFGGDYVRFTEEFVWLHGKKLGGSIDRVKVIDAKKKIIRIQDYKTNGDIHATEYQNADSPFRGVGKKALKAGAKQKDNVVEDTQLGRYWLQLSLYAYILMYYGYTVEGLDIYWLNPVKLVTGENAWEEYSHDVIKLNEVLG